MAQTVEITYRREDGSTGSMACDPGVAAQSEAYYLSIGYAIVARELFTYCDTCSGTGRVRTLRRHNHSYCGDRCWKRCADCNGN